MPTLMARVSRKLKEVRDIRRIARKPFRALDQDLVRKSCLKLIENKSPAKLKQILAKRKHKSIWTLKDVVKKCGREVSLLFNTQIVPKTVRHKGNTEKPFSLI